MTFHLKDNKFSYICTHKHNPHNKKAIAEISSAQVRQYLDQAYGSVHVTLSHYENVGSIKPITTYGTIVSNAATAEWHQKILQQYLWMTGYRAYVESENPRSGSVAEKKVGSDYVYTTLRYRLAKAWTYRSSELSASLGHYINNAGLKGDLVSVGIDFLIP